MCACIKTCRNRSLTLFGGWGAGGGGLFMKLPPATSSGVSMSNYSVVDFFITTY